MADTDDFDPHAYSITIRRAVIDGDRVFHGKVGELPDLEAFEDSFEAAYDFLVDAISMSKAIFDEKGKPFPQPASNEVVEYSGRVTLRMPKWLHGRMDSKAQLDGMSLNSYLVAVLAAHVDPQPMEWRAISHRPQGAAATMVAGYVSNLTTQVSTGSARAPYMQVDFVDMDSAFTKVAIPATRLSGAPQRRRVA